jgi:hypothetical protein
MMLKQQTSSHFYLTDLFIIWIFYLPSGGGTLSIADVVVDSSAEILVLAVTNVFVELFEIEVVLVTIVGSVTVGILSEVVVSVVSGKLTIVVEDDCEFVKR